MPSYKPKTVTQPATPPSRPMQTITAGDVKAALSQLTEEELRLPIVMIWVGDNEGNSLTMTVSNSFDKPQVSLIASNRKPGDDTRLKVFRV